MDNEKIESAFEEFREKDKKCFNVVKRIIRENNIELTSLISIKSNMQLMDIISNAKFNCIRDVNEGINDIRIFTKYLENLNIITSNELINLIDRLENLDNKEILKMSKSKMASGKFISKKDYDTLIDGIENYEEFNSLYYKTLIQCIYEGIFDTKLLVIKNLRGADVDGNMITLNNGEEKYQIEISSDLSENIIKLSKDNIWTANNGKVYYDRELVGDYPDTVFRLNNYTDNGNVNYLYQYYNKIKKVMNNHIGYTIKPYALYKSGIIYRIIEQLKYYDIPLNVAFKDEARVRIVKKIIEDELNRCNSKLSSQQIRTEITGNLDIFI